MVLAPKYRLSEYRPDIPSGTLQQYGFAGMILEFIEAPEPQLAFYCQYHGLHNVPLADDLSPQQLEKVGSNKMLHLLLYTYYNCGWIYALGDEGFDSIVEIFYA